MAVLTRRGLWPVAATHLLACIIFFIVLSNEHSKGKPMCCNWESPGLHPILMVFAFVWLGPWASMSYTSLEWIFGMSHSQTKSIHLFLQTLAIAVGWIGFASKYEGSSAHFRSVHSLIGMLVLVGYSVQWVIGTLVFIPEGVDPSYKRLVHGWHGPAGLTLMVISFATVLTGSLSYAGKTSDPSYSRDNFNSYTAVSFLLIPLGILMVFLVTTRPKGVKEPDGQERAKLLNSTGSKTGWP
eukprot:m.17384 g.17384  ORF g.17384 m.17384 type:complete len:240 (+) comp5181_c0_seq1:183-902(+)